MRSDLDKNEKKECVIKVKEVLDGLKGVKKLSFEGKSELQFATASIEDLQENGERKTFQRLDSNRKVTQSAVFQSMKGYLQKKNKQALLMWDERFFSIKNERLYWYKSHKALEPINSISLNDFNVEDTGENPLRFNIITPSKTIKLLANSAEDKKKWISALQKPEDTEIHLNLINEITKESLFEDVNRVLTAKRDLMKIANLIIQEIPRNKRKKSEKVKENSERPIQTITEASQNEETDDPPPSWCNCLSFLKRSKKAKGVHEPLIIN